MEQGRLVITISRDELLREYDNLSKWHTPDEFCTAVDALTQRVPPREKFNNPAMGFLLEAWALGCFARLRAVNRVRLAGRKSQFPDGYVEIGGSVSEVEIAEASEPGRRRGLEYQFDGEILIEDDPAEDWDRRLDALPGALETTLRKKVAKRYQPPPILLLYLNISAYGHRDREMLSAIRQIKTKYAAHFAGLHILWAGGTAGISV
jgi:hypothetical protein